MVHRKHFTGAAKVRTVAGVTATLAPAPRSSLAPAFAAAAGLAAAVGVGRFIYTPLLPIMADAHRISAHDGAVIATANYAGYLLGAILLTRWPELNSRNIFRLSAALLIVSEALMAVPAPALFGAALRLIAGVTSAVVFVACAGVAARHGSSRDAAGIAFSGVGFGIALTGLLVLAVRPFLGWQSMWLVSAVLTAVLLLPTVGLDIQPGRRAGKATIRSTGAWRALLVAYFLEGLGYIVIGTFLVAAVSDQRGQVVGSAIWVVVGAVAVPTTVLWGVAARRWAPAVALPIALLAQCVSAVLPAVSTAVWPAVLSATLFGATFMGIVMLAIRVGGELSDSGAAAPLTAVYGAGQMLGPLVVAPVIGDSYPAAFAIAAVVLAAATIAAGMVTRLIRRT
ncbi:YbfB/YjiJ family MFS transporter [Nocardia iowensis]|uniref:YbfB/YjiJ family MFS transporter n=1 Tax=Nocardia iowensis TaxID=204891 RepID=A0ABX8RHY3_NOCIO|nr:YbfB/YjiJ family MFS transporter [Nocardia iowensis]